MNADLVFEIVDLALSLAESQVHGTTSTDLTVAQTLVQIAQKSSAAYQQHTGEPLDPSLIKPEATI
jgi:hypothetical protein